MSVFYPFDTVRSRLQVDDTQEAKNTFVLLEEIARREGVSALYRGLGPVLQSLCASNFVYFYTFHGLKAFSTGRLSTSALRDLFLGSVAGIINVFSTTPLWVVNTRIKMQDINLGHQGNKYRGLIGLYICN